MLLLSWQDSALQLGETKIKKNKFLNIFLFRTYVFLEYFSCNSYVPGTHFNIHVISNSKLQNVKTTEYSSQIRIAFLFSCNPMLETTDEYFIPRILSERYKMYQDWGCKDIICIRIQVAKIWNVSGLRLQRYKMYQDWGCKYIKCIRIEIAKI